jgi:hypothetical protein
MASTLYPKPGWLGTGSSDYNDLNTRLNGLPDALLKVKGTAPVGEDDPSYGTVPGLTGAGMMSTLPGVGAAAPLAGAGGALLGAAAVPAAIAYGAGKLLAPKWTDEKVQQIKDFLAKNLPKAAKKAESAGSAYLTGIGEAVPASRFLEKKLLPQEILDKIKAVKAANPVASALGTGAGSASLMAAPGMTLVKGAGFLPMVANTAINAAPFAAGTGLDVGAETGSAIEGLKAAALAEGTGTALGAGANLALKGLSRIIPKIKKGVLNASVGSDVGVQTRPLRNVVQGAEGDQIARAERLKEEISALARKSRGTPEDISTEAGKLKTVRKMESDWDTLVDKKFQDFKKNGGSLSDFRDAIYSDPRVKDIVDQNPNMIDKLDQIIDTASRRADVQGIGSARRFVRDRVIDAGRRVGASDDAYLSSELGQVVHDVMDANFVPQELKNTYARDLLLKKILIAEELKIPKVARSGSQTAARLLAHAAMAGAGSIIPGAAAVGIGGIANDLLGEGINKGIGKLATQLYPKLGAMTGEGIARLASSAAPLGARIGGSGLASGMTPPSENDIGALSDQGQLPVAEAPAKIQPIPIPNASPDQPIPAVNAGGLPPVPPPPPAPSPIEQGQQAFAQVQQEAPQKIGKWNANTVNERIHEKYARYVRKYGASISEDDYKAGALQATDNMNPMNPGTWKGMYDDPATAEKYFKDYMALQKIPLDSKTFLGDALNHYHGLVKLGPRLAMGSQNREREANTQLVQALSDITKQPAKTIDERLRTISLDRGLGGQQKKQAIVDMITREGSIDWDTFVKMGLI